MTVETLLARLPTWARRLVQVLAFGLQAATAAMATAALAIATAALALATTSAAAAQAVKAVEVAPRVWMVQGESAMGS